jgi:putative solute:sodium symporter small subunit
MQTTEKHREYWRRNLRLTGILLAIWFIVTFVMGYFAIPLAEAGFNGWPFSFWMAAQGSLVIYVLIIWFYARRMGELDREYDVAEGD